MVIKGSLKSEKSQKCNTQSEACVCLCVCAILFVVVVVALVCWVDWEQCYVKPEYPLASPANGHGWGSIKSSDLISLVCTPSAQKSSSWCKVFLGSCGYFARTSKMSAPSGTPRLSCWVPAIAKFKALDAWKLSRHSVFDVVDREGAAIEISRRLFLPSLLAYFPQDPAVWGLGDKSSWQTPSKFRSSLPSSYLLKTL